MKPLVIAITLACASLAPAQNLRMVNAIITVFGAKLTTGVTFAADVHPTATAIAPIRDDTAGTGAPTTWLISCNDNYSWNRSSRTSR